MTKRYEKYTETIKHYRLLVTICDWCGVEIPLSDEYTAREFTLEYAHGTNTWAVNDLCDICAERLHRFLIENGVNVVKTESE